MQNLKMGSIDRSKKKIQLQRKAAIHFSLCFITGFFIGFVPTSSSSIFSMQYSNPNQSINKLNISQTSQIPSKTLKEIKENTPIEDDDDYKQFIPHDLLIIITTISNDDMFKEPFLVRLAHTLKLLSAPLLWIVVEAQTNAQYTDDVLRRTGIMYRHLTYKENFTDVNVEATDVNVEATDVNVEADHMRNVALNHIEYHRLNGIVHFADVSNVYDLEFIEEMREIDMFGAWPVAMMSANRKPVMVDSPICESSKVVGWQMKELSNNTLIDAGSSMLNREMNNSNKETRPSKINISSFAFNSSILWDPERWGRPSSIFDTSQDSIKFVQEVVLEDDTKLKAIPHDCSQIGLWHLQMPRTITPPIISQND